VDVIRIKEIPTTGEAGNTLCEFTMFDGKPGCYSKPVFGPGIEDRIAVVTQKR
jgi:hypothetical protein